MASFFWRAQRVGYVTIFIQLRYRYIIKKGFPLLSPRYSKYIISYFENLIPWDTNFIVIRAVLN
jgi:hypothetical protein